MVRRRPLIFFFFFLLSIAPKDTQRFKISTSEMNSFLIVYANIPGL